MQKLYMVVFVEFSAKSRSGPTSVICRNVSDEDCPTYVCGKEGEPEENPKYNFYIKGEKQYKRWSINKQSVMFCKR
ncbi:hypothetical protein DSECCO2_511170 [anaerobic digester metagenome]